MPPALRGIKKTADWNTVYWESSASFMWEMSLSIAME